MQENYTPKTEYIKNILTIVMEYVIFIVTIVMEYVTTNLIDAAILITEGGIVLPLVSLKDMLVDAQEKKYAIAHFNVSNYEMIKSVIEVAEELNSPVILSFLEPDLKGKGLELLLGMAKIAATNLKVPVCLHLDHCTNIDFIKMCVKSGFTSVMYDGSQLSFSENIQFTKEVCDFAHEFNVTVEGELGHVTDAIVGNSEGGSTCNQELNDPASFLTEPHEVQEFVTKTGVDALAIAIGTAHGKYIKAPQLDFVRLAAIRDISPVPLVIHGGSGVPDQDVKESIKLGICKVNIYTELLDAYFTTLRATLNDLTNICTWPVYVYEKPTQAMKQLIHKKIMLVDSANRA